MARSHSSTLSCGFLRRQLANLEHDGEHFVRRCYHMGMFSIVSRKPRWHKGDGHDGPGSHCSARQRSGRTDRRRPRRLLRRRAATASGPPRSAGWRTCATRRCWRTTTSCPPSRTSPTTWATRWRCRGSPPRRPRTPSCSAACTSWPRPPRSWRPHKTVLIPDQRAGCSLADSITADELRAWKDEFTRRRRGVLRQHHRRGEGAHRHLLHLVQCGRGGGLHPEDRDGAVLPGPVPRRARPARHRPQEPARLGRRMPRARRHQR